MTPASIAVSFSFFPFSYAGYLPHILVGLLFAVLGAALYVLAFMRARHSRHDFADYDKPETSETSESSLTSRTYRDVIRTKGQENTRIFGRPFVTAGWIVIAVATVVAGVEIGLLVLVLKI